MRRVLAVVAVAALIVAGLLALEVASIAPHPPLGNSHAQKDQGNTDHGNRGSDASLVADPIGFCQVFDRRRERFVSRGDDRYNYVWEENPEEIPNPSSLGE